MNASSPTPHECVVALQQGQEWARDHIERWVRQSLTRLVDRAIERYRLNYDRTILTERILHWVFMYLRSRDASQFIGMSLETFLAQVVFSASRVLSSSTRSVRPLRYGPIHLLYAVWARLTHYFRRTPKSQLFDNATIRESIGYTIRTHIKPAEEVGGDWIGVKVEDENKVLWLMVADVTGHGYPAYILASGLPFLWQSRSINDAWERGDQPAQLLDALGRELEAVLPGDLFVEATLGRFTPAGDASVAVAGACPVVIRQVGRDEPTFFSLGGTFLGLEAGIPRNQQGWKLQPSDELMIASDGLFEQRADDGRQLKASLLQHLVPRLARGETLHDSILETLNEVLGKNSQGDDITLVTVRFGEQVSAGRLIGLPDCLSDQKTETL